MRSAIVSALAVAAGALRLDEPVHDAAAIAAINAGGHGWTAGVNSRFEGYTLADASALMGTITSGPRKVKARANLSKYPGAPSFVTAAPTNFSVMDAFPACANVSGHIRDQSDCGSCWAMSSTEAFNDRMCITHGYNALLSVQDTASCCSPSHGCPGSNGCDGGMPEEAWQYFVDTGVVTGDDYDGVGKGTSCFPYQLPFCSHHEPGKYPACSQTEFNTPACPLDNGKGCSEASYGTAWAKDKHHAKTAYNFNSIAEIESDLQAYGSVTAAFTVYSDFLTYKSGIYKHTTGAALGGHAVKIVGWGNEGGREYWLVANSWNSGWGDNGFFKIAKGVNECGIEDDVCAGRV